MTNEELEEVMNFIIKRQENFGDVLAQQQALMGTLIESQNTLTETVLQIAEGTDARIKRHDEQFAKQGEQLAALAATVEDLARTVKQYITTRGTNGDGGDKERQHEMKNAQQSPSLSARMVEDETAEKLKKRLRDAGLIVNAGAGKAPKPKSVTKKEKQ